ncbi:MAG TPA: hypothetical protein VH721_00460 [Gaiellaceae bacterium]
MSVTAGVEASGDGAARPVEERGDGGARQSQLGGDLVVRESLQLASKECLPLSRWQRSQGVGERIDQLGLLGDGSRRVIDELGLDHPRSTRAQAARAYVVCDRQEPGQRTRDLFASIESAPGLHERLLDGVCGVLAVAEPAHAEHVHALAVALVERCGACLCPIRRRRAHGAPAPRSSHGRSVGRIRAMSTGWACRNAQGQTGNLIGSESFVPRVRLSN